MPFKENSPPGLFFIGAVKLALAFAESRLISPCALFLLPQQKKIAYHDSAVTTIGRTNVNGLNARFAYHNSL
ncbi:MAG: hypothetical protein LBT59_12265 [Clostridiales bacterium]|nr:hypothetical protein [Clostridiales bacterium]